MSLEVDENYTRFECTFRSVSDCNRFTVRKVLFKVGDDLRQDQLVLQLIRLMNTLLLKYGLDLCLTPYKVIALVVLSVVSVFTRFECSLRFHSFRV